MAQTAQRGGLWRSVRSLPARTPLRVKLITALLALVAVALAVISIVGIGILRNNLLETTDANLARLAGQVTADLQAPGGIPLHPHAPQIGDAVIWVPDHGSQQALVAPVSPYYSSQPVYLPWPAIPADASTLPSSAQHPVTLGSASGEHRWRAVGLPGTSTAPNGSVTHGIIVVAVDATSAYTTIGQLATIDWLVSLAVIVLLGVVAIAVIRASLRPLTDIEKTAGAIAAGDLTRRVPERDPRTEVGRLGRSLNDMLSQIESAFHAQAESEDAARRSEGRMRQFVADASHELRTPLTAIRGFAEYYRQRGGIATEPNGAGELAPTDLDRIMRRVEQEAARMGILVEDMLLLARLDQQRPFARKPVDLLTLAADAVHDARVQAPNRSINLTVGSGAALLVLGDETRLRQVIGNLMSNALSHTPDGTPIDVLIRSGSLDEAPAIEPAATSHEPAAVLEVSDHGPGLTAEQAEHAFERFYRADQARTPGGTGLGLAIVAALVSAHGGRVWVTSEPGNGATFYIALPLTPEAAQAADEDQAAPAAQDEADMDPADRSGN